MGRAHRGADTPVSDPGDIVVTSMRRSATLAAVPMAVSVVNGDALRNSGVTDLRALTQLAPSLLVSSTQSEAAAAQARIRGVGTVGDNPGLESSVSVFVDGVYRPRTGMALTELGAVDRIEVLRGPQGTLFGRNASAGLIHVILHSPSGVAFEVKIACIRALDKDFLPQAAPAVAQTAGSGRIRPRSRCFLAQGRRFSAQRTDLSSRFRSV
ncbi:TonB-dependent receptor [Sphingobium sp. TKS]|nr:TonB-dependent receptor [Sphingobium sp. TKS]